MGRRAAEVIIRNATILTMNDRMDVVSGSVVVRDGQIDSVGDEPPDLTGNQLIATIGHELQHATEIGNAPSVVSRETLSRLYRTVGSENYARSDEWETAAAQRAGDLVRRELASPVVGVADSTQARLRSERK